PGPVFTWPLRGQLANGSEYMLIVYTLGPTSTNEYRLTITPRPLSTWVTQALPAASLQPMTFSPKHIAESAALGIRIEATRCEPEPAASESVNLQLLRLFRRVRGE
ncbi:MAG: hypothetical protein RMN25_14870, partial [Anaerolineae bacterium]|nr:hypothetical protein [Thermoflexales bacterium]MDW8409053.1 hypothetical protein [Anaerolineae bacterium]